MRSPVLVYTDYSLHDLLSALSALSAISVLTRKKENTKIRGEKPRLGGVESEQAPLISEKEGGICLSREL
jgi:hypothetical protein